MIVTNLQSDFQTLMEAGDVGLASSVNSEFHNVMRSTRTATVEKFQFHWEQQEKIS